MNNFIRAVALLLSLCVAGFSQVDRAAVTGVLRDPSGAVVAGGKITVTLPATSIRRSTLSNGSGVFLIAGLPVGHAVIQVAGSGELPTKQMRKMEYFGYVQDEWKVRPNLTANIGLRYEFFNAFTETHHRDIPFDMQSCGGYCQPGSDFAFPPATNFAPRLSLAWSPGALKDRTVIRVGAGIFYGDAQLGDQYSPANNDASRSSIPPPSQCRRRGPGAI